MRRILELDAVRGLAAMAIVVFHIDRDRFFFGWTGVHLFFVLSGYLITTIVITHPHRGGSFLKNFYARRALRIWPIYYIAIALVLAMNGLLTTSFSPKTLPFYLTYTQNIEKYWFGEFPPAHPAIVHTWTLAIEEQFYIIWPALVMLAGRRFLPLMAAAFIGVSVAARAAGFDLALLLSQSDGFAFGGLLAALFYDRAWAKRNRTSLRVALGLACLAGCAYQLYGWVQTGGAPFLRPPVPLWPARSIFFINLSFFGLVGLILTGAGQPGLAVLREPRLCYLGTISYGIYLYHPLVFYAASAVALRLGFGTPWWLDLLMAAVSLGVAAASWEWIERPIMALKKRFEYSPGEAREAASSASPVFDRVPAATPRTVASAVPGS